MFSYDDEYLPSPGTEAWLFIYLYELHYEEFEDTKGQSESVYRRRTDKTMSKRTNNDQQNIHIKLKIE